MAIDLAEKPINPAPPQERPPTLTTAVEQKPPRPEIYQGNVNKMDVLNLGEQGHDRAVPFQLKQGTQKDTFVLGMDAKNPGRVINLDTSDRVSQMTPEDFARTAILQRQGNELSITTPSGQETRLTQEQIRQNPHLIQLTGTTGVEILDFDPEENSILIHKAKPGLFPVPIPAPFPVPFPWMDRLKHILLFPPIIGAGLVPGMIPESPPAIVRPVETPQDAPQLEFQIPETLKCPATKEMTVAPGDSLTKLLVDVNGLPRYLATDGKTLDIQKLYQDLACMLVIPENRPTIAQSDSDVASLLDTAFQNRTLIGPVTAKMIYDLIDFLNATRSKNLPPGASPQLVIIQPGQKFLTPDFTQPPAGPEPKAPLPRIPNPPIVPHPAPAQPQGQRA